MEILKKLEIREENLGAYGGYDWQSGSGKTLISYNPATEEPLAKIRSADSQDYEQIIRIAQEGFLTWRKIPAPVRGECVRLIAEELRSKKDLLGTLVSLECGKIKAEGDGEIQEMIDIADLAVGQSRMLYGKTMHSERPQHRMYEQWHPLGPVGVLTAFNFPVAVWAWNAFIAVICGNSVVWKPSPKVPLCAIAVQQICNQVTRKLGYPGIFSLLITDDNELAKTLVADDRLPLISFTGSSAVGKQVAATVSKRFGKQILELSGNNAIVVDETADLDLAVPAIVFGAVGTAGQRCTSTRRVIVHHSRYDKLIERLVFAYQQVNIGDPLDPNTLMGPVIDEQAIEGYVRAIDTIKNSNGQILFGGKVLERPGFFVMPTLVHAHKDWELIQHETFAPILYVLTYETLEEAIAIQNGVSQGLSSAIFTENLKNAEYFLSASGSDCGIANVNIGTSGAEIGGAFGGEKETGGGREAGSDSWKNYMRCQTNTINWSDELPLAQGLTFTLPTIKVTK